MGDENCVKLCKYVVGEGVKAAWLGIENAQLHLAGTNMGVGKGGEGEENVVLATSLYRGDNQEMDLRDPPTVSLLGL